MKTWKFEVVVVERNGKPEQQYFGEDDQLALEILKVNTSELRNEIKEGTTKVFMVCK